LLTEPLFTAIPSAPQEIVSKYQVVRQITEKICAPLEIEDYGLQAMNDASPAKWHLGHVMWFFETFLLKSMLEGYTPVNPVYEYLFNSYYDGVGPQWTRAYRAHLSRPTVSEVYDFRSTVDRGMLDLVEATGPEGLPSLGALVTMGLNHEQQHQELLVTDIKYNLSVNPMRPAYHDTEIPESSSSAPLKWLQFEGGVVWSGHDRQGFAFDNEWPRHQIFVAPFKLASRLTTNGEFMEFIDAGGYDKSDLWLSEGFKRAKGEGWDAPLYWEQVDDQWWFQTMSGMRNVDEHGPVAHVSYFEADAFARWSEKRLATEHEWEHAASPEPITGNFLESGLYHPASAHVGGNGLQQMYGDLWEWTQSPYAPYPGYRPLEGTLGEYNGKFMVNHMVLRGGSCATPSDHIRPSYRNFSPPDARWQFSGIRLADEL
jgi:ergothioneine biosynthesis protein EgtB